MIFMDEMSFRFHIKDLMAEPHLFVANTKACGIDLTCVRSVVKLHLINSRENKKYLRNFVYKTGGKMLQRSPMSIWKNNINCEYHDGGCEVN